jgi:hypothetical protein
MSIFQVVLTLFVIAIIVSALLFTAPGPDGRTRSDDSNWRHW